MVSESVEKSLQKGIHQLRVVKQRQRWKEQLQRHYHFSQNAKNWTNNYFNVIVINMFFQTVSMDNHDKILRIYDSSILGSHIM